MEEEQEMIHHFTHDHPLTWIPSVIAETDHSWIYCRGCDGYFEDGDAGYRCSNQCPILYHEDCAEMPRKIRHPLHPSHLLTLEWSWYKDFVLYYICAVCETHQSNGLIYFCSSRGCKWWIHLRCAAGGGGLVASDHEPGKQVMNHPSHPEHEMRLLRRKKRSCSFKCDACGTTEKGNSYICSICEYWIHESCAALPTTAPFHHHHPDHSLSLAFHLPVEYIINGYSCGICDRALGLRHWVYHCELCRYVVHIKCATNTSPAAPSTSICNGSVADDHKIIIKFPLNDIYEEILKPFVERERGDMCIPHENISENYEFHKHHHPLSLITFSRSSTHVQIEEEEEEDEDEDDDPRLEIKCDGCTTHIHQNYKKSSSTSSYLSCDDCKYFLHLACFNLPQELSSHPLHQVKDHKLKLQYFGKLTHDYWPFCRICRYQMNGLYYACTECEFKLDIKCASLPETIRHNGHPQDLHYLKLVTDEHKQYHAIYCGGCRSVSSHLLYRCDSCKFSLCKRCVFLPEANKHGLMEKHRLPLTYDAHVNHPSEFYCGSCEEMDPKTWMYYCRKCEESFHPQCFPTTSGRYRNINFGMEQYYVSHHPHRPLRFQVITKKQRCDVCRHVAYDQPGFQCVSCNFVMCFYRCGKEHMDGFKVIKSQ